MQDDFTPVKEKPKSVTLYLDKEVLDKLDFFSRRTVRSKSQSAEYLIRMGMEQFVETAQESPKDEPSLTKKRVRGRPKMKSIDDLTDDTPEDVPAAKPKRATRKPAAKKPAAKKPAAKKPAARKPATKKPATRARARKPRAKPAAA